MAHEFPETPRVDPWHGLLNPFRPLRVRVEDHESTVEGYVDPCEDLDGRFTVVEDGTGERLMFSGWRVHVEVIG